MSLLAPKRELFLGLLPPAAAILIWETLVRTGALPGGFFPAPSEVYRALLELALSGKLLTNLGASLLRVFSGYLAGASLAVVLGLLMGYVHTLRLLFRPSTEMLRTVSPIAWIPLAVLWFGIGNAPGIFIIAITCFFPVLVAAVNAVDAVDPHYRRLAANFGASPWQELSTVIIPASIPPLFVGLRISLGIAWVVIVAAEMVGMRSGLGYLILDARNIIRTDLVVACMIIIGLIGFCLDAGMRRVEQRLLRARMT